MKKNTLNSQFDKWKKENNQNGHQAFSRFIMLIFLDSLQKTSDEFIFKGGNLLWHYIRTNRETTDLDLATLTLNSHQDVRVLIENSFKHHTDIKYSIIRYKEIINSNTVGADITLSYLTTTGQSNQFSIDIVFALPTDITLIKSTIDGTTHRAASIENIICDKLSAAFKYKSGNTRMKDFDDLWKISNSNIQIDNKKLKNLLLKRNIPTILDMVWADYLEETWKRHSKSYKELPKDIKVVFQDINLWLSRILEQ